MIFRHCWECMMEVTPSGRCVVDRVGNSVLLVPVSQEAMRRLCLVAQAETLRVSPGGGEGLTLSATYPGVQGDRI